MQYYPYYYNPYAMNYTNPMWQDEMRFEDEDFDFELYEEEEEYYDEMMRQADPFAVNRIMRLINTRLGYLYNELQRYNINRNIARYIFRNIVSFTIANEDKYKGTTEQKTTAILGALRQQQPWIFFFLRASRVPVGRVNQILRTIIAFTLSNLAELPAPPPNIDQRATRIVNQIRQQTDVFKDLESYGVTASIANSLVRATVTYTLRNINVNEAPANIPGKANELLGELEKSDLGIFDTLEDYNIPRNQIRNILRAIILFTLRDVFKK